MRFKIRFVEKKHINLYINLRGFYTEQYLGVVYMNKLDPDCKACTSNTVLNLGIFKGRIAIF